MYTATAADLENRDPGSPSKRPRSPRKGSQKDREDLSSKRRYVQRSGRDKQKPFGSVSRSGSLENKVNTGSNRASKGVVYTSCKASYSTPDLHARSRSSRRDADVLVDRSKSVRSNSSSPQSSQKQTYPFPLDVLYMSVATVPPTGKHEQSHCRSATEMAWPPASAAPSSPKQRQRDVRGQMSASDGEGVRQRQRSNSMPDSRAIPREIWESSSPVLDKPIVSIPPWRTGGQHHRKRPAKPANGSEDEAVLGCAGCHASLAPIGSERKRADSFSLASPAIPLKLPQRSTSQLTSNDISGSPAISNQGKTTPDAEESSSPVESKFTREELSRLLLTAQKNPHAPMTISPLSPLRNANADHSWKSQVLSTLALRKYTSCSWRSMRYEASAERRYRSHCEPFQPHHFEAVCTHCRECTRDSIGKRLLARRLFGSAIVQVALANSIQGNSNTDEVIYMTESDDGEEECKEHLEHSDEGRRQSLWDEMSTTTVDVFAIDEDDEGGCGKVSVSVRSSGRFEDELLGDPFADSEESN